MKIGIIGLRPHQIADIQNRKFPFDFEFYTDKTVTRAKILAFAQRQAKVLIVVRGTTNDVPGWVDSEKKVIVHGAASAVVRALNGIVNLQQLAQATPSTSRNWHCNSRSPTPT